MAQKTLKAKKAKKSSGSVRKNVGHTPKKFKPTPSKNIFRDKANSEYIKMVEDSVAARVPSDQRDKLHLVKASGISQQAQMKKHLKKPLTRGRTRHNKKQ